MAEACRQCLAAWLIAFRFSRCSLSLEAEKVGHSGETTHVSKLLSHHGFSVTQAEKVLLSTVSVIEGPQLLETFISSLLKPKLINIENNINFKLWPQGAGQ